MLILFLPLGIFYSLPMVQLFIHWLGLQGQRFDYFNQGCSNKAVTAQTVFSQLGTAGRYNKDDWSDWVMVQPNYHHNQYQHYQYHVWIPVRNCWFCRSFLAAKFRDESRKNSFLRWHPSKSSVCSSVWALVDVWMGKALGKKNILHCFEASAEPCLRFTWRCWACHLHRWG